MNTETTLTFQGIVLLLMGLGIYVLGARIGALAVQIQENEARLLNVEKRVTIYNKSLDK